MNIHLENIKKSLQDTNLPEEEKQLLLKQLTDADKQWAITDFKLDRTEKVKKTTAILLEETIEELEQKRKSVEAQTRESQIQLALERVRARTMAMQHSDELADTASILFQQIKALGFEIWSCGFFIWQENDMVEAWMGADTGGLLQAMLIPYKEELTHRAIFESQKQAELSHEKIWEGKELENHYAFLRTIPSAATAIKQLVDAGLSLPTQQCYYAGFFNLGYLLIITKEPNDQLNELSKRFAKVFEQTYTRFLDLQKAEAQARESKIEASLEKVRSRSLAMQKSDELKEVIQVVYEQFVHLNVPTEHAGFVIDYKLRDDRLIWVASKHGVPAHLTIPYFDSEYYNSFNEAKEKGSDFFATNLNFEDKNNFYRELFKYIPDLPEDAKEFYFSCLGLAISTVLLDDVGLYIENFEGIPYSDEDNATLMRFGKVFQQTYTRFLDLQKAEAQAREAEIELALERVRARTMAMQHSNELLDAATLLFQQIELLGASSWNCSFNIWDEDKKHATAWNGFKDGFGRPFKSNSSENIFLDFYTGAQKGEKLFVKEMGGLELENHYKYLSTVPGVGETIAELKAAGVALPTFQIFHSAYFAQGYLMFITYEPVPEFHEIFKRFTKVFEQTYTRFLDLQKAEAQTRESQIEVAVERVRAQSMAMHQTTDLEKVNKELYNQLQWLKINGLSGVSIYFLDEDGEITIWDLSSPGNIGDPNNYTLKFNSKKYPVLGELWQQSKNSGDYFTVDYPLEKLNKAIPEFKEINPDMANAIEAAINNGSLSYQWNAFGKISSGVLGVDLMAPASEDTKTIVLKMAAAFNLAYKRFLDLQKAEDQSRESQVEAGLERVRSRTLAMQTSNELAETAAVLFKQLIGLGIAPNRLYIGISKEEEGTIEFWVTDEDGSKISTMFTGDASKNKSMKKMYDGWKKQEGSLIIDMKEKELTDYFHYLGDELHVPFKEGLSQKRRVQTIAYFSKGFIGIASPDEQPQETIHLLERFAGVFNLTFTRFNDLKIAEGHALQAAQDLVEIKAARLKAENALIDLQAAQKQLVQSEKMASLGELTAGIAHEIQNPLNFVNNFSEVSKELLEEMKAELDSGNIEDAKEIMADVIQNLEKINHHGKRADGIVKGMLQHSRSSSGQKELTDINALCDEYLRLSYHGLRAKDKSFNATIKTDFDKSIEKINIISQDIGRVILNLLTNAFYVVNEKKQQNIPGYEPIVSVSTKRSLSFGEGRGEVQIKVTDNGNGIPQNIIDKIFQPFFTTKPTGQGTGLGLSLSYDIITKGHGGELKVETKEREGSTFIIQLPA